MRELIRRFDEGERWLLLVLYAFIVIVIFVEVLRRFVLQYSSVWGEETARYLFVYLVWIGASAAIRDRAHLRIDVVFGLVSPRVGAWLHLFGDLVTLAFACLALWLSLGSVRSAMRFDALTDGLRINQAWFALAVPLGFGLIVLRLVQSMRRDVSDLRAGKLERESGKLFG
ncbi:MAG: TRAP transporter small permease [Burkholderiaceae bacterium]